MGCWMAAFGLRSGQYPLHFTTRVLGILSLLNLGFICFALFTSNPFLRLIPLTPADGADLNPLCRTLPDCAPHCSTPVIGLAIAWLLPLVEGRWIRPRHDGVVHGPTWRGPCDLGITLGSWWAYYELGWGGWWFQDPVENASLMPWLAAAALVHSLSVTENRGTFKSWTLLLAITAFSFSLLEPSSCARRTDVSVHSFAVDPERRMYGLIFLALVVGSLSLYAARAGGLVLGSLWSVESRVLHADQ